MLGGLGERLLLGKALGDRRDLEYKGARGP
jgi:hypothetical protein